MSTIDGKSPEGYVIDDRKPPYTYKKVSGSPGVYTECNLELKSYGVVTGHATGGGTHLGVDVSRRYGIATPDARMKIARGDIIMTPYALTRTVRSGGGGVYRAVGKYNGVDNTWSGPGSITFLVSSGDNYNPPALETCPTTALINLAKTRALSAVDKSQFAFMEDLTEMKQTLGMLRNPLKGAMGRIRQLEKAYASAGRRAHELKLKGIPLKKWFHSQEYEIIGAGLMQTYLEVKYSLAQVFYTAIRVSEDLQDRALVKAARKPNRFVAKGKSVWTTSRSDTVQGSDWQHYLERDVSVEARAGVIYSVRDPDSREAWTWRYGIRAKDIVPNAWAVMRLSWLVDQFVNVGNSIRAVENFLDPDIHIAIGWVSVKQDTVSKITTLGLRPGHPMLANYNVEFQGDTFTSSDTSFNRYVWVPTLYDTLPSYDPRSIHNITTLFDSFAVAISSMKGLAPKLQKLGVSDLGLAVGKQRRPSRGRYLKPVEYKGVLGYYGEFSTPTGAHYYEPPVYDPWLRVRTLPQVI